MFKNGKLAWILITLSLIFTIMGGTFAYWSWSSSTNKNVVFNTSRELREYIIYDGSESVFAGNLGVDSPIHSTLVINKKNEAANVNLTATIHMDIDEIGTNMQKSRALKWKVTSGDDTSFNSEAIASGNFIGTKNNDSMILVPNLIVNLQTNDNPSLYTVWIWLDSSEHPSSNLSGESLETRVWTEINQTEGTEDIYSITRLKANNQNISTTVVSSLSNITAYAVTTSSDEPTSWTSITPTKVYNLTYVADTLNVAYYVWFKDEKGRLLHESIVPTDNSSYLVKFISNNARCPLANTYVERSINYNAEFNVPIPASTNTCFFNGWSAIGLDTTTAKYGTNSADTAWSSSTLVNGPYFKNLTYALDTEVTLVANYTYAQVPDTFTVSAKYISDNSEYTNNTWTKSEVYLDLSVSSPNATITKFEYSTDGGDNWSNLSCTHSDGIISNNNIYTCQHTWTMIGDRNNTLNFRVTDSYNRTVIANDTMTVKYDVSEPDVNLTISQNENIITVTINATDPSSGLAPGYYFKLLTTDTCGVDTEGTTGFTESFNNNPTYNLNAEAGGNTHYVCTKVVDNVGNIAYTSQIVYNDEYCKNNNIQTLSECLIRNDTKQTLQNSITTIANRSTNVDFNVISPVITYETKRTYDNKTNKTDTSGITSTSAASFTYVVEDHLIDKVIAGDTSITKLSFNTSSGAYTYTNSVTTSNVLDLVTTQEDIDNNIFKYTCLNATSNGNCTTLYLFTEVPYLISNAYRFKQGYIYTYKVTSTSNSGVGIFRAEDDYTNTNTKNPITNDNYSYYYRGNINNNWVSFGGFLWRVVRINGDGSIRMIYSGLANSNNHTGSNAQIGTNAFGYTTSQTITTPNLYDGTQSDISINFSNGRYGTTYVGYMYNPEREIATYPDKTPGNTTNTRLNYFPTFTNISNTTTYYFFKDFDPETDCTTGTGDGENGTCVLKCLKLGEDGDEGIDCVQSNWNTLATTSGNYSTEASGIYPATNPTQYIYTSPYKYTCWGYAATKTVANSNNTTSVYVTCPIVSEIVGTVKDQATQAKVKYHGLFSADANTSNANVKDSAIKTRVETWYHDNILGKYDSVDENNRNLLEDYITDQVFCNDRTSNSDAFPLTTGGGSYIYGAYTRNASNKSPSYRCPNMARDGFTLKTRNEADASTVTPNTSGNHLLKYPVGLITMDEAAYAGGRNGSVNPEFYLYTGTYYWTLSPSYFYSYNALATVWIVYSTGLLTASASSSGLGVRPVINLISETLYSEGSGTELKPYVITLPSS